MKKIMNLKTSDLIVIALSTVMVFVLLYIIPYTRDDWAWGSRIGLNRLFDCYNDYNGRYAGNTLEIILTRSRWLRALVETTVLCGLAYFMSPKKKNKILFYYISMCALFLSPTLMMRQTIIYTAGFTNYIIPMFFVMLFIRYFESFLDNKERVKDSSFVYHPILLAIYAFIAGLFMEYITLYLLCISGFIVLYSLLKCKKIHGPEAGFFLGSIAGTVLMFSNSTYWNVLHGKDGYRALRSTDIDSLTDTRTIFNLYFKQGYTLYAQSWFLGILIVITVYLIIRNNKSNSPNKLLSIIGGTGASVFLIMILLPLVTTSIYTLTGEDFYSPLFDNNQATYIYAVFLIICFLYLFISSKRETKKRLLFLVCSIIILNLPLLFVNPVSPRCIFPTYVLTCVFLFECIKDVSFNGFIKKLVPAGLLIALALLISIYIPIYKADNERLEYINGQIKQGKKVVVIDDLPRGILLWGGNPQSGTKWERRYKAFYDIPKDIQLLNVPKNNE